MNVMIFSSFCKLFNPPKEGSKEISQNPDNGRKNSENQEKDEVRQKKGEKSPFEEPTLTASSSGQVAGFGTLSKARNKPWQLSASRKRPWVNSTSGGRATARQRG